MPAIARLFYVPYTLLAHSSPNSHCQGLKRRGMLIKAIWRDGLIGYADCHPWIELGDPSLDVLRQELAVLQPKARLLQCSLYLARQGALAFTEHRSLFQGLNIPSSHYLISDIARIDADDLASAIAEGFTHVKVKVGRDVGIEVAAIQHLLSQSAGQKLLWRFDANARWNAEQFEYFINKLSPWHSYIDFIEDPTPFCSHQWRAWQKCYGIALAADRYVEEACGDSYAASVLILKSAVIPVDMQLKAFATEQRCVFTSYLDHPLGQLGAAWCAAVFYQMHPAKMEVCGLLTHGSYKKHVFSHVLRCKEARLITPGGYGWGIEELLQRQSWRLLTNKTDDYEHISMMDAFSLDRPCK